MSLLKNAGYIAANPLLGQAGIGLNKLTSNQPQAQSVAFDDDTKGLLQKQQDRANESADDIVARNTAGMDAKAQSFFDASQVSKPEKNLALGLGPISDDLDSALAERASRNYQDHSAIAKSRMKLDANDEL